MKILEKRTLFSFPRDLSCHKFCAYCSSPDTNYVPSRPELHLVPASYLPILKLTFVLRDIQFLNLLPFLPSACPS